MAAQLGLLQSLLLILWFTLFGWMIGAGQTIGWIVLLVVAVLAAAGYWYWKYGRKRSNDGEKTEKRKGWFSEYAGDLPQLP